MRIIDYFSCSEKETYLAQIKNFEWRAAKFLAMLLEENRLQEALGGWGELFLLLEGDAVVSFLTLSERDCIAARDFAGTPWLGFFHTAPAYRGNRYGKILIDHACDCARLKGYETIYIATDHVGLYEKYGFTYIKNAIDIYGEDSRIYRKTLKCKKERI